MKKIISLATKTKPYDRVYIMKCSDCGCKFTYQLEDIYFDIEGNDYVKCPNCNEANIILFKRTYKEKMKRGNK